MKNNKNKTHRMVKIELHEQSSSIFIGSLKVESEKIPRLESSFSIDVSKGVKSIEDAINSVLTEIVTAVENSIIKEHYHTFNELHEKIGLLYEKLGLVRSGPFEVEERNSVCYLLEPASSSSSSGLQTWKPRKTDGRRSQRK